MQWAATLEQLGPQRFVVAIECPQALSDGYETLQASRTRLDELQAEKEQRRRERQSIAKRIETLYLEALEVNEDADQKSREDSEDTEDAFAHAFTTSHRTAGATQSPARRTFATTALDQTPSRAERTGSTVASDSKARTTDRSSGANNNVAALWAKCGVATRRTVLRDGRSEGEPRDLQKQHEELDKQSPFDHRHARRTTTTWRREIDGRTASRLGKALGIADDANDRNRSPHRPASHATR